MIKKIFLKYKDIIMYLIFGVLTTLINIISYFITYELLNIPNVPSTIIAWILSVIFAFITNKLFVFESKQWNKKTIKELTSFTSCRIGTGLLELVIMYIFVDLLNFNGTIIKIITNVIVIILNYIFSKLIIFKKSVS